MFFFLQHIFIHTRYLLCLLYLEFFFWIPFSFSLSPILYMFSWLFSFLIQMLLISLLELFSVEQFVTVFISKMVFFSISFLSLANSIFSNYLHFVISILSYSYSNHFLFFISQSLFLRCVLLFAIPSLVLWTLYLSAGL